MRGALRATAAVVLGLASSVAAQASAFEPADFNVTKALIDEGVDVSALPQLASLGARSSTSGCAIACTSLQILFASAVTLQGDPAYDAFTSGYWAQQQADVDPFCIFRPATAAQVSVSILIARLTRCPFAAKSGGHASFAGASNAPGGITISLEQLNTVQVSADGKTVELGPGNTWASVYTRLQPTNVSVVGGRAAGVGVGGLTTGGGISFFSNLYGWTCDNVVRYELVTASGVVLTVSATQHPDLYFALRGSGNNFGIVTKFTVKAIPLPGGLMWGGVRESTEDQFDALIDAFYNLGANPDPDPNAAHVVSFSYVPAQQLKIGGSLLEYAKPVANASILAEYLAIPAEEDTTRVATLAALTEELDSFIPPGSRESFWTATVPLNKAHLVAVRDIFYEDIEPILDVEGLFPDTNLQIISPTEMAFMAQNGGNPLGLAPSKGPLLLMNVHVAWRQAADDVRVLHAMGRIIDRCVAQGQAMGLAEDYLYMNYASQFQDVIASYGADNKAKLQRIAAKYDPQAVFQTLQPGFFKLDGSPVRGPA